VTVGVVPGDDVTTDALVEAIEAAGRTARVGDPATVRDAEPALLVTVGEEALLALADERPTAPLLPIDAGRGIESPNGSDAVSAVSSAFDGTGVERTHPHLTVVLNGEPVDTALMDVMLVTSEPARISEYAIERDGERLSSVRADGVVVATPVGSHGYAAAADGPALAVGTDAVCVVPIAPFHTTSPTWVLDPDDVGLSVLRDEGDVSLLVDGRDRGFVGRDAHLGLRVDGSIRLLCVPEGRPAYP
jgi:NAD+ kinase